MSRKNNTGDNKSFLKISGISDISTNEVEMTYWDNDVVLRVNGLTYMKYNIIRGSYIVEDFSVTSGQDPNGEVYSGLCKDFGSDGKITFRVGRKKSSAVANWFNSRVSGSQNTFNHTAGELDFAFIGTLEITISGGILGSLEATYQFSRITLAQGHAGTGNNWWFGGSNCNYSGRGSVVACGIANNNQPIELTFWLGSNAVAVNIANLSLANTATWMSKLNSSTRLNQIIMPGSHDAGMSSTNHCAPPKFLRSGVLSKTQSLDVSQQLSQGARYFDLRVDYDYGELVTYHRSGQWGCNGISLSSVLDGTRNFLIANPSETAILKFSHIRNDSAHNAADIKNRINIIIAGYMDHTYKNNNPSNVQIANIEIGEIRGKMVLVFDYDEFINPSSGLFRYHDGNVPKLNLTVFDEYSNSERYEDMQKDQLDKWRSYGGLGKDYLFLLSWILTPQGIISPSVEYLAGIANSNLASVLNRYIIEYGTKPNVVYVDFLNGQISQAIIQYNYTRDH